MKNKLIRIAPILLIVVLAFLAIALIVTLGQKILGDDSGSNQTSSNQKIDLGVENLLKNEPGRSVKMTVRGPIVASENFHSYSVEISQEHRSLKTYKGYLEQIIDDSTLQNNSKAYDEFIHALNKANMMKGKALTGEADDLRGVCASGHIYDFAILNNGQVEKHLWTSTCGGSKGSLDANVPQLQNLFISQIPNNNKIVKDLGIANLKR